MLLTATPVNNSLWDLYSLLYYFIRNDAAFADAGVRSLRDHFASAMAVNPDDLSPEHLFDVLDAVAVRRTRPFVKRYYPNDTVVIDGRRTTITFPTPRVPKVGYNLDAVLPGFFGRFAHALDGVVGSSPGDPDVLTLARYAPSRYRVAGVPDTYELQLAGLLRSGLLKRFESSAHAFARTCATMADSHDGFLSLLGQGKVATGAILADWMATDTDELDDVTAYLTQHRLDLEDASEFDDGALATAAAADRDLLRALGSQARQVTPGNDPKLAALVEELADIAAGANAEGIGADDTRDKPKVLVFSYFADTVDWITDHLLAVVEVDERLTAYRGRITSTSGRHGNKEQALWGFAPRTTDAPGGSEADRFDIVVATDVLAEGVNLQQARHIINYDLPWNPMRLVQRHGRIDRIGSRHTEVFLRCFFPDAQLEAVLGLEERLQRKIKQAAASVGVGGEVLPGSQVTDVTFSETVEDIERLRAGDAGLFERGGTGRAALSGEEYRQQLREAHDSGDLMDRVLSLPWGSGSGMARVGAARGYVFCAQTGDHPRRAFRYVEMADPLNPVIIDDTLTCLAQAQPPNGPDTERALDGDGHRLAFDAWTAARAHITAEWNVAADPANLHPTVPKAMRDAAALVQSNRPPSMTLEEADRLVDVLETPYPERTLRQVRRVLASAVTASEKVEALAQLASDLGLEPGTPLEPLPEVDEDDVHLVCWLAIVPSAV